ncbi:MAG: hypothetical protein DI556_10580 [Rhodovulum sulfidophilum]|uniref:Uncharacterized protein n=1 Tax=Rhodovulum sulfidophilum TaxID=35806 RepID=A0A2W5NCC8_RHOSU|nr:MAG: hypothetical protein DI556_10580 [Rhodovulum sulfidophilum]
MSTFITLLATGVSLAALLWLSFTDPKRRRSFGLKPYDGPRRAGLIWTIACLPGLFLPVLAGGAGFVLWLGALTVLAWAVVAVPPGRGGAIAVRLDRAVAGVGGWLDARARGLGAAVAALRSRAGRRAAAAPGSASAGVAARVAELERKVMTLETELARLRHAADRSEPTVAGRDARVA